MLSRGLCSVYRFSPAKPLKLSFTVGNYDRRCLIYRQLTRCVARPTWRSVFPPQGITARVIVYTTLSFRLIQTPTRCHGNPYKCLPHKQGPHDVLPHTWSVRDAHKPCVYPLLFSQRPFRMCPCGCAWTHARMCVTGVYRGLYLS